MKFAHCQAKRFLVFFDLLVLFNWKLLTLNVVVGFIVSEKMQKISPGLPWQHNKPFSYSTPLSIDKQKKQKLFQ